MKGGSNLVFLFLGFIFLSCSKDDSGLVTPFESQSPVVTGIWLTYETGPEVIGSWGYPSDPPTLYRTDFSKTNLNKSSSTNDELAIPTFVTMDVPYPNPTQNSCAIRFSIIELSKVNIWIVKARFINEKNNSYEYSNGAVCINSNNQPVRKIIEDKNYDVGFYSYIFDGNDNDGNPLPAGFYRVYFSAGNTTEYHDIFLFREFADLPMGLSYPTWSGK